MNLNDLPQVRTIEDLRSVMTEIGEKEVTDQNIIWFACIANAESLSEANLRELGNLFLEGITPMAMADVQELISTFVTDDTDEYDGGNRSLLAAVARFYSKHELAQALLEDDDECEDC